MTVYYHYIKLEIAVTYKTGQLGNIFKDNILLYSE